MKFAAYFILFFTIATYAKTFKDCDKLRDNDVLCMACNLYQEAQLEPAACKQAIASVVINRLVTGGFGDSVCEVIWRKGQFTWTSDGKNDRVNDNTGWDESIDIAQRILSGSLVDNTQNSLWYHAYYVDPSWPYEETMACASHTFYRKPARKK